MVMAVVVDMIMVHYVHFNKDFPKLKKIMVHNVDDDDDADDVWQTVTGA